MTAKLEDPKRLLRHAADDPLLLGLDLGLSTVKAGLFAPEGMRLELESEEYRVMAQGGREEATGEIYWAPVVRAIRRLLARWGGDPAQIEAVSVSTYGETVFPLGSGGRLLRPPLAWDDTCARAEADELVEQVGAARVLQVSGQPEVSPIWPVAKLRWLSKHEPDLFRRTVCFLLPGDYIVYRLCNRFVGHHTLWGSSLLLDIRRKAWDEELLAFATVTSARLPELYGAGVAIGTVSHQCGVETGLSTRTAVVTGAMDQMCAAVGAGNLAPGIVTESTGSVLALLVTVPEPVFDMETRVPCFIHALPDTFCLLPWNPTGGLTLKWFKDRFALEAASAACGIEEDVYSLLMAEASLVSPGCDGLVMLPHLEGALFPEYNAAARGVFFGFTLGHTRAHFLRAILESVAFMMRRDLDGIHRLGIDASEVRVLGGGAKSRLWSQIKADVLSVPVVVPGQHEAAVLGAAVLAGVGARLHRDIPTAVAAMVRGGERLTPDPANRAAYDAAFDLYVALYESVKHLFRPGNGHP
jgi:xylulokinase